MLTGKCISAWLDYISKKQCRQEFVSKQHWSNNDCNIGISSIVRWARHRSWKWRFRRTHHLKSKSRKDGQTLFHTRFGIYSSNTNDLTPPNTAGHCHICSHHNWVYQQHQETRPRNTKGVPYRQDIRAEKFTGKLAHQLSFDHTITTIMYWNKNT